MVINLSSNKHTKHYLGLFAQCAQYLFPINANHRFRQAWILLSVCVQGEGVYQIGHCLLLICVNWLVQGHVLSE